MFTNKHVVVALLVAPVLAILAWLAVDYFLSERPHAAIPGASYTLIPGSNCRYEGGRCDLVNGNFRLRLRATGNGEAVVTLTLRSSFALQQAAVGIINGSAASAPSRMTPIDANAMHWSATLALPDAGASRLGIAVDSEGARYFAEFPTTFLDPER